MGVVKQEVKRSAGRSGFMGSISFAPQEASWMHLLSSPRYWTGLDFWGGSSKNSLSLCRANTLKESRMRPEWTESGGCGLDHVIVT